MPPPDESSAIDPTGTVWVVWIVIVGPLLLFVALSCVRRVAPGELVAVVRQGQVVRSRRRGLLARWPGVERFEPVPTAPRVLPLVVRSGTHDGLDVVVLADLVLEVRAVADGARHLSDADVVCVAEQEMGRTVRALDVTTVVEQPEQLASGVLEQLGGLLPSGTHALELEVTRIEALLTPRRAR